MQTKFLIIYDSGGGERREPLQRREGSKSFNADMYSLTIGTKLHHHVWLLITDMDMNWKENHLRTSPSPLGIIGFAVKDVLSNVFW